MNLKMLIFLCFFECRFCTTGLSSDMEIEVDDMTYHLNKFLLMSKSRKLHQLITEQGQSDEKKKKRHEEDGDGYTLHIKLENFPGGPEIFEMVVKVCYGVKVNLSASTAVLLRCAAEELEMTEEYSPDNLILKTENFLSHSVLSNTQETIAALKACEPVTSLAESIGITKQCIDSIVSIASSSADPSLFGWPMNNSTKQHSKVLSEDLLELSFPIFKRVVQAMKAKDLSDNIVEISLIRYAKKHIPLITSRSSSSSTIASENQQRELLETIISYLPVHNSSATSTTRSLFGLLRSAIILNTSEKCRTVLEKKIGSHLEKATLDDLLIPSYSYLNETLYDIDLVERLIRHFLQNDAVSFLSSPSLTVVGKLIDGALCEIASDANLKPERFYSLAVSLPDEARLYDDGLYRAIDIYLKSHPRILEAEREKICSVMDFQKLTIEGCTHAAQNERLPLRAVVKVLFLEQLQLRTLVTAVTEQDGGETAGEAKVDFGVWEKVVKENEVLRLDMDAMRTRLYHLESEYLNLKEVIAKIDKERLYVANARPRKWSISNKFGCKFKTQVCDSHEAKMVDGRCQRR
ncbi:BTB/POZ domain-containing protein At3g50840-like isoform X1 [Brassica napus]|uniref:BTB/POZ domain-containing protein At3g50840-like isoform X1 n=1 Tax=Brassica napus TaxID=3708 RepID=UPI002078CA6F|nr:BTB/POZ domain-containing protein At3g50840-like isoform X1 [Brassica napus]